MYIVRMNQNNYKQYVRQPPDERGKIRATEYGSVFAMPRDYEMTATRICLIVDGKFARSVHGSMIGEAAAVDLPLEWTAAARTPAAPGFSRTISAFCAVSPIRRRCCGDVSIVSTRLSLDCARHYSQADEPASAGSSVRVRRYTNALHPTPGGYRQIGDVIANWILTEISQSPTATPENKGETRS